MEKIYSKVQPGLLLHQVFRSSEVTDGRIDLCNDDSFIQCASLRFDAGKTFPAHKHRVRERKWNVIAQESWHVVRGSVMCHFYDIDGKHLRDVLIGADDTSFTFHGGHTYTIKEDGTVVREFKTGRYEGQETDKVTL